MPVKSDVKERLKADGVWKSFCARREELKAEGHRPAEAQRVALEECDRSDDSPALVRLSHLCGLLESMQEDPLEFS